MITLEEYVKYRPIVRSIIAILFGLRYEEVTYQSAHVIADCYLSEFESFPGSIKR